jgi:Arc/MetJ family transcription regulator
MMLPMRTTVTLDADVVAALQRAARERGTSFKAVLNDAVRRGLGGQPAARRYRAPSRDMGLRTGVDIDKALALAAADEDAESLRKLALRK